MDDLVKVLGPFAKRILANDTPVKPKTAPIVKKKETTNFSAFHKKNSRFGRNIEESRPVRSKQIEDRRKANRDQLIMEKRAGLVKTNVNVTIPPEESGLNGSNYNGIKESRREQLSRWKQEKEAIKTATAGNKRVPFKAPAPAGSQNFPAFPIPLPPVKNGINSKVGKTMNATQEKKVKNGTNAMPITTTRVTRSMVKAQNTSQTSVNAVGTATNRLKELKLNTTKAAEIPPKAPLSAKSRKIENSNPALQVKKGPVKSRAVNLSQICTPQNSQFENSSGSVSGSTSSGSPSPNNRSHALADKVQNSNVAPVEPPKKVKKPKGMQFDDKYLEYNESFVQAGKLLQNYSNRWNNTLTERNDIPEDVVGQINSAVGQAKLLLDSKLPQFAELLYFYLSRHQDPGPVLPCDLEGWWDVANISVEKVKDIFEELAVLERNAWIKPVEVSAVPKPKSASAPNLKKSSNDSNEAVKTKPKANAGLLAFLAQKRNKTNSAEKKVESGDGDTDNNVKSKSPSPQRQFEGGFFEIRSPARKTATPVLVHSSTRKPDSANIRSTPRRRQSEISLRMLAVRNSMGPICKIGVLEKPQEPEIPITTPEPMDPVPTISLFNPTFRQKLVNYLTKPAKFPCFLQPNIEYINARGMELYPVLLNGIGEMFGALRIDSRKRKRRSCDSDCSSISIESSHNGSGDFGIVEVRRIDYEDICTLAKNEQRRFEDVDSNSNLSSQDTLESSFKEELSVSCEMKPSPKVSFFDRDTRKSLSLITNVEATEILNDRKVSVSPFILKFYGSPWDKLFNIGESRTNRVESSFDQMDLPEVKQQKAARQEFLCRGGDNYALSENDEYEPWGTSVSIGTDRISDIEMDPNDIHDPEPEVDSSTCSSYADGFDEYDYENDTEKPEPTDLFLKPKNGATSLFEEFRTRKTKPRSSRNKKYRTRRQRDRADSVTRRREHCKGSSSDRAEIESADEYDEEFEEENHHSDDIDYVIQEFYWPSSTSTNISKPRYRTKTQTVIKKKTPIRSQPSRPQPFVPVRIRRLERLYCTQHLTQYIGESTSQNSGQNNNPESEFRSSSGILKPKFYDNNEQVNSYVKITKESIRTLECTRDVRITRTKEWVLLTDPSFGSGSHREKAGRSGPSNMNDILTSDSCPDSNAESLPTQAVSDIPECTTNDGSLKNSSDECNARPISEPSLGLEASLAENQYSSGESLSESFKDMDFDDDNDDISYIESVARYERLASINNNRSKSATNSVISDYDSCKEFWDDGLDDEYDHLPDNSESATTMNEKIVIQPGAITFASENTSQPLSMNAIGKLFGDDSNSLPKFSVGGNGEGDHVGTELKQVDNTKRMVRQKSPDSTTGNDCKFGGGDREHLNST